MGGRLGGMRGRGNRGLTERELAFVEHYVETLRPGESCARAGYADKRPARLAYQMLQRPAIQAAIELRRQQVAADVGVNFTRVVRGLLVLAEANMRCTLGEDGEIRRLDEMGEEEAYAISGMDVLREETVKGEKRTVKTQVLRYRMEPRIPAWRALLDHLNLGAGKGLHGQGRSLEDMSEDEIDQMIAANEEALAALGVADESSRRALQRGIKRSTVEVVAAQLEPVGGNGKKPPNGSRGNGKGNGSGS